MLRALQPFLGREFSAEPDYSDEIAREIDDEIRRIVEMAHSTASRVLEEHKDELYKIADILMRRETIERDEFLALLDGRSEDDVFGPEEPAAEAKAESTEPKAPGLPGVPNAKPGLAGGGLSQMTDETA